MKDQSSTISQILAAVYSFVDLYIHVDLLLNDIKFKELVAMELQVDLRLLPTLIIQILPTLNTRGNLHDRNFYRVLKLMCKVLEEARDSLDEYMTAFFVSLLHTSSFNLKLEESRSRIKHAVSLYNTYCIEDTSLYNAEKPKISSIVYEDVMNMWKCITKLDQNKVSVEEVKGACSKRILIAVSKLRAKKSSIDEVEKWREEDMEQFCKAGWLEALISLLSSSNSQSAKIQALKHLGIIVAQSEVMKKRIVHVNQNNDNSCVVELIGSTIALSGGYVLHEGVRLLRTLIRNNGNIDVKKACQPAVVAALLKLLVCNSSSDSEDVLGVLWEFSVHEDMNCRITKSVIDDGVLFERMIQLCEWSCASPPAVVFCTAALMQNLCMDADMKNKVLSAGASETLLYLIENFDMKDKVMLLRRIKGFDSPLVMGWAVSMMDSTWERNQIRGLDLLLAFPVPRSLALLQLASQEGSIPRLVKLLDSSSTLVVEKAIEALHMLSMPEENEKIISSDDNVIQKLIQLLESDFSSVRGNAIKVLESLSFNPINKEKILNQHRSVERAADLLFHESISAQSSACSLLWNLANTTMDNKIKVASIHGVPSRLSELLLSETPLVQEKAAGAIMSLSYNGKSRKMVASTGYVFERLIKLLDSVTTSVHRNAAGAMYNLSISPHNIAAIGAHPRAVADLVGLLCSKHDLVQEYAAGALGNLALIEEMREEMKNMGAIVMLKKLKDSTGNASVRTQAKRALDNLMV